MHATTVIAPYKKRMMLMKDKVVGHSLNCLAFLSSVYYDICISSVNK